MRAFWLVAPLAAALVLAAPSGGQPRSGWLIVLNKSDDNAALVDPHGLFVRARVPTGQGPHEVAVSADGRRAYVSNYGLAAVFQPDGQRRNAPGKTITVIDLTARSGRDSFDLGNFTRPHGIAVSRNGERVWVTCEGAESVLELDAATGAIQSTWPTGQEVSHMLVATPDEAKLYVASIGSGSITVIDRARGATKTLVSGAGTEGIDVSPDGRQVWASNRSDNTLTVVDTATDSVIARFPSGGQMPIRLKFTPDGRQVFVSNAKSNTVTVFDVRGRKRIGTVRVGAVPVGIQMAPDGRQAFVACTNDDRVKVIDVGRRKVVGSFFTGREPDGMAWAATPR
jgi:YVTN family beta-propeller protein